MQLNLITNINTEKVDLNNTQNEKGTGIFEEIFTEIVNEVSSDLLNGENDYLKQVNLLKNEVEFEVEEESLDEEVSDNIEPQELLFNEESNKNTNELDITLDSTDVLVSNLVQSNSNRDGSDFENREIGEKNIDSVKYISDDKLSSSIENLLKNNMSDLYSESNLEAKSDSSSENTEFQEETFNFIGYSINSTENEHLTDIKHDVNNEELDTNQKEIFKQIREGIRGESTGRSMQVMLKPHHLGKVNLNLKFYNNAMHINVFVENDGVEDIIKNNIEQLMSSINPLGNINIGSVNISKVKDAPDRIFNKQIKDYKQTEKYRGNIFVQKIMNQNYR